MKAPSRRVARRKGLRPNDPKVWTRWVMALGRYYRRLVLYYLQEARKWMMLARAEHDLNVALMNMERPPAGPEVGR
jgi:hypothetical protein